MLLMRPASQAISYFFFKRFSVARCAMDRSLFRALECQPDRALHWIGSKPEPIVHLIFMTILLHPSISRSPFRIEVAEPEFLRS
jgi:hypothetical protein